jgi:2-hydroxy-6-oxonona-2,4-dienedioate hydrolase
MEDPKFVNVDGIRTRYFEGGRGEDLVLIHGGKFGTHYNAYHWSLNFEELCKQFHVYAFDKLGMGYTDNPKSDSEYTMGAFIEHAHGFIRTLGIKKATLVGHSRGALPAARIAVDRPELVRNLIILDSSTLAPDDPSVPLDFYSKLEEGPPSTPNREFVCREPEANSYSNDHITDDFIEAMLKIALLPKTIEAREKMEHLLDALFLPDVRKRKYETIDLINAGRLKAPTLIIWGANDRSSPMKLGVGLLEIVGKMVNRTQFHTFNHAAHYVFREHPHEVNQLIINFVKNSSST